MNVNSFSIEKNLKLFKITYLFYLKYQAYRTLKLKKVNVSL